MKSMIGIVSRDQSTVVRAEGPARVSKTHEGLGSQQRQCRDSEVGAVVITENVS